MNRRTFLHSAAGLSLTGITRTGQGSPSKYRACVIGDSAGGGYGHDLHLMWGLHPAVEVVGLADPEPTGRERRAAEAGAKRTYADYRRMLTEEKPDLVSIGPRWTVKHLEYLLHCAEAGAHGLIEKPLCVDLTQADAMYEAVAGRGLKWSIAFNFRASPVVEHARRLIVEEGLIGEVLEVRSRGKEDHRAGGEDLIVMGAHTFDMMIHFLGPPRWCSASIQVGGRKALPSDVGEATEPLGPVVGDRLQATFGFSGGVNAYFSSMKNDDGNQGRWGIEIYGTRGVVTIRMTRVPEIFWLNEPSWAPGKKGTGWRPLPQAPVPRPGPSRVWHYTPIVADLIGAVEDNRRPRVSLEDGRASVEMTQAVFESHVQGGRPVPFPLERRDHPLKRWT